MKADENWKHTKLDNKAFILFVLLLSYLVNFIACFFVKFKKQFSLTWEVNLKIKGTCGGQNERYLWWSKWKVLVVVKMKGTCGGQGLHDY